MPLGDSPARCLPGLWLCGWFLPCGLPGGLPRLRRALPTGALLHGTLLKAAPPPPRAHVCFVSGLRLHSPLRSSLPEAVVQSTASRARNGRPGASLPPHHCGPRSAQARPCCHVPGEHRPDGNGLSLDATRCRREFRCSPGVRPVCWGTLGSHQGCQVAFRTLRWNVGLLLRL